MPSFNICKFDHFIFRRPWLSRASILFLKISEKNNLHLICRKNMWKKRDFEILERTLWNQTIFFWERVPYPRSYNLLVVWWKISGAKPKFSTTTYSAPVSTLKQGRRWISTGSLQYGVLLCRRRIKYSKWSCRKSSAILTGSNAP